MKNLQCNLNTVKQKLLKVYTQDRKQEMYMKPKLRKSKDDYFTKQYKRCNLKRTQRSLCAHTSPVAAEVGRYKNT